MVWSIITTATMFLCWICSFSMDNKKWYKPFVMIGLIIAIMITSVITATQNEIEAIDVYRGKTSLKITEKTVDGVVVERDSVVIFKNNEL